MRLVHAMYPFLRFAHQMLKYRKAPRLSLLDTHVSSHLCLPWDLDPWAELNNGRTLTLYDMGRLPLAARTGVLKRLGENGWGITVAGVSVRYRRRIKAFQRVTMRSRTLGWDDRFLYMDQSMWRGNECLNQMLLRAAIVSKGGMVAPRRLTAMPSPPLPDWVEAWIRAEAARPWPPQIGNLDRQESLPD